jgi:hypothetical protein
MGSKVGEGIVGWTFMVRDSGPWGLVLTNDARTYH